MNKADEIEKLFYPDFNAKLHNLLEDFEIVGNIHEIALIDKIKDPNNLRDNIQAAIAAFTLRLSSIDYAKKQYCNTKCEDIHKTTSEDLYIKAYKFAKEYMENLICSITTDDKPLPINGVFGASLALERLKYSFFSAHFLYRLGHRYEGHAVSRLILEQIAWAYAAYPIKDIDSIAKIKTTKAIATLKKCIPEGGLLYGFLSDKTHIDYRNHSEFLDVENNENVIKHTQGKFYEYSQIILYLADLFGIVWELSQREYLPKLEAIIEIDGNYVPNKNRIFLKNIGIHLNEIKKVDNNSIE